MDAVLADEKDEEGSFEGGEQEEAAEGQDEAGEAPTETGEVTLVPCVVHAVYMRRILQGAHLTGGGVLYQEEEEVRLVVADGGDLAFIKTQGNAVLEVPRPLCSDAPLRSACDAVACNRLTRMDSLDVVTVESCTHTTPVLWLWLRCCRRATRCWW